MKKFDYFNVVAIALAVLGIIVAVIGGSALSPATSVGMNTNLSPVLYIGCALIAVSLILAIIGSVLTEKHDLNKVYSTIALYLSVLSVMFVIVYTVLVIVWPVLRPTNG